MNVTRRTLLTHSMLASAGLLGLSGCKNELIENTLFADAPRHTALAKSVTLDYPAHVLMRLSYGIHPHDRAKLLALNQNPDEAAAAWIESQLVPEHIDDHVCERLVRRHEALAQPLGELYEYKEQVLLRELTTATVLRAVYSQRQLHERLVGFWHDHFNVDMSKGECAWVTVAYDRDIIRANTLGKFSDLLRAVVLSPAMLWYLDGRVNRVSQVGMKPNENYARELLELHTLGLDGGYSQNDIMEVARCLSGWSVRDQKRFRKGTVEFHPQQHDNGEKIVLGTTIAAGGGERDVDRVLALVTNHPATARHIARKLCQHFIHDQPSPTAIAAVEQAFINSQGDIATTMRALTATSAFHDPEQRGAKLKRPFHYLASCLRATAADSDGGRAVHDYLQRLGHLPFQFPTPDGQPDHAEAWTGTLLWRWRFADELTRGNLHKTKVNIRELLQQCGSPAGVITHVLGRQADDEIKSLLLADKERALSLLLASPMFQHC